MMRLDKFLAECGFGSRSELKKMVRTGCVTVNGDPVKSADLKINEDSDEIRVKGVKVEYERFSYYLLHKPAGCVTAVSDQRYPTVMQYLPADHSKNLSPVGRLDLDTEGLLLITNDGQLSHHLLSPAHHVSKTYYAKLDRPVPKEAVRLFAEGVDIGDEKPTLPAQLQIRSECEAELTICEGRFHQVKRMFETVGCTVIYLKRMTMGTLSLGNLPLGECRKLTVEEVEALRK